MVDQKFEKRRDLYEFKLYCNGFDFNEIIARIDDNESIGWYNFIVVDLIKTNGNIEEGAEIYGVCLSVAINDLRLMAGNRFNYHPMES